MRKGYKIVHGVLAGIVKFIFRVKVHGLENDTGDEGILLCSNHVTLIDPVCLSAALRKTEPFYMAKKELFKIPLLNSLIRAFGAYPVNRGSGDIGALHKTIDLLKEGHCVGIFPQGTRCKGVAFEETTFKSGTALILSRAHVPVLPVRIKVKNNRWRPFRRIEIIIGKKIEASELAINPDLNKNDEMTRITNLIYDRIAEM
ncbi:MAG: lysophospholipid acyltransferase family protein [Clostridia bacterium]|nr:lysophospholipid acyltransferase family protein [Clostridia bacterium]